MKILLMTLNVFNTIGGGQTFIKNAASKNIDFEYYCFGDSSAGMPYNVRAIPISDHHRGDVDLLNLDLLSFDRPELSLAGKQSDIALMLDMAAAVTGMEFDIVEIPDFMAFGALAPMLLEAYGVRFRKIVLSLHGVLSHSIEDLWQGRNKYDLTSLRHYETLAYRMADTRYGISERYVEKWSRETGLPGLVVDPMLSVELSAMAVGRTSAKSEPVQPDSAPSLNFVGRQDWIKGPDLFLSIVANLPPDRFNGINLYGSPVNIDGVSSESVLGAMAQRRGLTIGENGPVSHTVLFDIFSKTRSITFVPSRVDTFNLVALESLLNGCPTVISTACGITDYLDKIYPDLPYVKLDPDNIWAAIPDISAILQDYDGYRARLGKALAKKPSHKSYGVSLQEVYRAESAADRSAQQTVRDVARKLVQHIDRLVRPKVMQRCLRETEEHVRDAANRLNSTHIPHLAAPILRSSLLVTSILHRDANGSAFSPSERDDIRTLTQVISECRTNRIPAYRILADLERKRGNELLYAVYNLRCFRSTGKVARDRLDEVVGTLEGAGYKADAVAAKLLLSGDDEQVYAYLKAQASACTAPGEGGIEFIETYGRRENPRIAILVSIYNAASKVPQFLRGLRSFVDSSIEALEIILVDSGSSDATSETIRRELAENDFLSNKLDVTLIRSRERETIQSAWNRALVACRAPYITFLGVDEMMRPDSLEILAGHLDKRPSLDWVQGNAIVCDVNEHGSPVRDVMVYDRQFTRSTVHYLDCCYMGYVGGLYRRSIHDRAGYYNGAFRAAGDNEFKNRALPMMAVMSIPDLLGTFRNFPEARTTESPVAELEDYRAWHLPRSVGGLRYAFENADPMEPVELFLKCLKYRKSYMNAWCTDLDFALNIADYLQKYDIDRFYHIQHYVPDLRRVRQAYQTFDEISTPHLSRTLTGCATIASRTKDAFHAVSIGERALAPHIEGLTFSVINDNRHHQYQNVWKSRAQRLALPPLLDFGDLAGAQDLAEVFSSCVARDREVDFEQAWESGRLDQVKALFAETAIDFVLPLPNDADDLSQALLGKVKDWFAPVHFAAPPPSLALAGKVDRETGLVGRRIYILGQCKTYRPVLAAAHCILLPYWDEAEVAAMLETAIECSVLGKPMIIAKPLWESVSAFLGKDGLSRDFNEAITVCEDGDRFLEAVSAFVKLGADRREVLQRASRQGAVSIRRKGARISSGDERTAQDFPWLMEWDADLKAINHILHAYIERGVSHYDCFATFERLLQTSAGTAKLRSCIERCFVTGDAFILETDQAAFRQVRSTLRTDTIEQSLLRICRYFGDGDLQADAMARRFSERLVQRAALIS